MSYMQATQTAEPSSSLMDDAGRAVERLGEIHGRLLKLGGVLFGAQLRDLKSQPEESATTNMRRHVERSHILLGDIEAELSSLESRL
jgi:hypothetical protein